MHIALRHLTDVPGENISGQWNAQCTVQLQITIAKKLRSITKATSNGVQHDFITNKICQQLQYELELRVIHLNLFTYIAVLDILIQQYCFQNACYQIVINTLMLKSTS